MAFSSGTYNRTNSLYSGSTTWAQTEAAGIGVRSADHDNEMNDIATALSTCLLKDGTQTVTANIPFGGFKATGLAAGTAATDAVNANQLQTQAVFYGGTSGGSANAQTISLSPAILAYTNGQKIRFKAGFTNTSAATLNVNGIGGVNLRKGDGTFALDSGDIRVDQIIDATYVSSVPCFVIDVQGSGWTSYSGSIAVVRLSSVVINKAQWRYAGNASVEIDVNFTGTASGSDASVGFSTPITIANENCSMAVGISESSTIRAGVTRLENTTRIQVYRYDGGNIPAVSTNVVVRGFANF